MRARARYFSAESLGGYRQSWTVPWAESANEAPVSSQPLAGLADGTAEGRRLVIPGMR